MAFETAWRILGNESDAEDAAQEAFVGVLRLSRERAIDNWGGMLRRLAVCRALDRLRQRRRVGVVDHAMAAPPCHGPVEVAAGRELADRLRQALAELPTREAEVFAMRYLGDLSNGQIAAELGINIGAVGVALHKARHRLEAMFTGDERT
jgi:RNA polymerase sigma-70 factor (ECF subfamily)